MNNIALTITILFLMLFNLGLGTLVFLRNSNDKTNRIFLVFTTLLTIWVLANYFGSFIFTPTWITENLVKLDLSSGILEAAVFGILCNAIGKSSKRLNLAAVLHVFISLVMGFLVFTNQVTTLTIVSNGVLFGGGLLYRIYQILTLYMMAFGVLVLILKSRVSTGAAKQQIKIVLLSLGVGVVSLAGGNLVLPVFVHDLGAQALAAHLSYIGLLVFSVGTTYAIIRHKLFDIRAVVARSLAYVVSMSIIGTFYGVVVFNVFSSIAYPKVQIPVGLRIFNTFLALLLTVTFPSIKSYVEKITDKVFYRDRYDSGEVLDEIGGVLVREIDIDRLLHQVLLIMCQRLHIKNGQFFIFNEDRVYKVAHFGPLPDKIIVAPELRMLHKATIVYDDVYGTSIKNVLESHGIRVSKQLKTKDEFIGYLLFGDKLSGDIYTEQDLKLLEIVASELAIAIQNAKSYERIRQFNQTLQQKVDEATKRLRVANANLKSLDKAKDEFISMASHQLRTPLTTIKGYVSMILEGDTGPITQEQREFLDYAFAGSERMVSLISDLLNVSRLAAGRFIIERTPTDIVSVVADEVRQLQSHAAAKKLKLSFTPPKTALAPVSIDENKTRQVMMNFIDNAIYYTKEGSVTVAVDATPEVVRFSVSDTGIGVPKEAQDKLFTKFYRAENAQTVRPDGTGLGLYLAKRVVEDQGGTILFESHEGKGSTFGFEIPLQAATVSTQPAPVTDHANVKTMVVQHGNSQ